jgi:glycosyltransferase involved in cell wall biosynthesis
VPSASVIVCTRNRSASLAAMLAALAADPSSTEAEVIVADNASGDRTPEVVRAAVAISARPLRTFRTTVRGHSRVRNEALRTAEGELCLFTDDDVTVAPGWIDALAAAFADRAVDAVGGRVIPGVRGEPPEWMALEDRLFRPLLLWDEGEEAFRMPRGRYPIGANMVFRRARLPADPFDPAFGHTGRAALGFDEWDLFDRLVDTHTIMYEPSAVVHHWVDGARLDQRAIRRRMFQAGVGGARFQNSRHPLPPYRERLAGTARALARARDLRRAARRAATPEHVLADLRARRELGMQVETLLATAPRLSERIARIA